MDFILQAEINFTDGELKFHSIKQNPDLVDV